MSDKTADTENKDVEKFEEPTQENVKTFQTFTFKDLQQFGGVVDRKPVQEQIEWNAKDGTKLVGDIWVRRQSFENFSSFLDKSYTDKNKVALAALIAKSLAYLS